MKRSAVVGIAVGAAAVIAVGVGFAVWSVSRSASPSEVAVAYFAALEAGDADAALALTDVAQAEQDGMITAYASAEARITDPRATDASEQSDSARVVVAYEIAEEPYESAVALTRDDSGAWIVADGAGRLEVRTTIGDSAGIGALVVPLESTTPLLPGRYDVEPLPRGLLAGSMSAVITPGSEATVALSPAVTAEAETAAQAQLDAYAAACTRTSTAVPPDCGLRVPWAADLATLTSIAYRVDQYPALTLDADQLSFAATGGIVVATATGTGRDGAAGSFTYRADDWSLRGTITFSGNEMVLSVG